MSFSLDPSLVASHILHAGDKKSHFPPRKLAILGFIGGFFISVGVQIFLTILNDGSSGATRYLGGLGFSAAPCIFTIAGAEMYPGNALIILAVLAAKVTWSEMLFEWAMVFSGNVLGAMASAFVVFSGGVCDDTGMLVPANATRVVGSSGRVVGTIGETVCRAALGKAGLHGYQIFARGILANVIACIGAFLAVSSPSAGGKVLSFVVTIQAFAASSYEHCIANVYTFSLATYLGCPIESRLLFVYNVVLATVGNIVGAAILAVAYYLVFIRASADETIHFTPAANASAPQVTRRGGVVSSEQPGTVAGPLSPTAGAGSGAAANQPPTVVTHPAAGPRAASAPPLPRWAQTVKNLLRVASGTMEDGDGDED